MYDIIHDTEKGIAALVNPEFGHALGPIAMGEDAVALLEQFAGMHGVDPSTVPTAVLHTRWDNFITQINDVIKQGEDLVNEGEAAVHDVTQTTPTPTEPTAPVEAPGGGGVEQVTTSVTTPTATETAEPPAVTQATPAAADPLTTAEAGQQICPTCDGFRTVAQGTNVVPCPTCNGAGQILAEQQQPTS